MDGIGRMLAGGLELPPIKMKDGSIKIFKISGLTLQDFAEIEQYLLKNRRTRSEVAAVECKRLISMGMEDFARTVMKDAIEEDRKNVKENMIETKDFQKFIDSREGVLMTFRMCINKHQPDDKQLSNNDVVDMLSQFTTEEMIEWRDRVSGTDHMGNLIGSALSTGTKLDPKKTETNRSDGTGDESFVI